MIATILIALDGSARASGVFGAALEIARACRARVVLYRAIVVPVDFSPAGGRTAPDPLPKFLANEARVALLALAADAPDVRCDVRIEETTQPWRSILDAGDAADADLIVLGSHGYHGMDRILGTTAGKVANLAHRNVMVVHDRDRPSSASLEDEGNEGAS